MIGGADLASISLPLIQFKLLRARDWPTLKGLIRCPRGAAKHGAVLLV